MGYKEIILKLGTDHSREEISETIRKKLRIQDFSYQIEKKSLDARNKNNIHWQIKATVISGELKGQVPAPPPTLNITYKKRSKKVLITGSGPAGFFPALILQKAGFETTIIERGCEVIKRAQCINDFENTGIFNPVTNYAFGEGGAGTFSDGKLTSRTKHIAKEKYFVLSSYVNAGAPEEILYMAHPHLGSDNLIKIIKKLRQEYINCGGKIFFETQLKDLKIKNGKVIEAITAKENFHADYYIIAPGHSACETYRMLIQNGVIFTPKNFAIGCRIEHHQEIINQAQWGTTKLPGLKAAEYRLTYKTSDDLPVYTFCMCPGGTVVNASAYENTSVVNGMSLYERNGKFANAACVAGIDLSHFMHDTPNALNSLAWLEHLERKFYNYSNGFAIPCCTINDFIRKKGTGQIIETSYKPGVKPAPLWELLPFEISSSIRNALKEFSKKIKGFETGSIMGLESKTSSPIQAVREKDSLCAGFENLFLTGEGSGHSGGIISSAVDGIKSALNILEK